jgi:hypothetical protein
MNRAELKDRTQAKIWCKLETKEMKIITKEISKWLKSR